MFASRSNLGSQVLPDLHYLTLQRFNRLTV
jgi:hypothetical protein